LCREVLALSDQQLAEVAAHSLIASAAPQQVVERGLGRVSAWLDREP
jgi:hypothetical protein